MFNNLLFTIFFVFAATTSLANEYYSQCDTPLQNTEQKRKLYQVNLIGYGFVTAWGVAKWDYFTRSINAKSEGWFSNDTSSGGADKLGHLYSSYIAAHGLSYYLESKCFNKQDAALYGALSSFAIFTYMELGDSFSNFGFSYEDLIANTFGSALGYYLYRTPALSRKIDLRWEYGFNPETNDFTTDYENTKYIIALKLNGFETTRKAFLKHFEIHFGYYTRGFDGTADNKERNLYLGIGLNITDLFRQYSYKNTATFLKYVQVPGTYVEFNRDINK